MQTTPAAESRFDEKLLEVSSEMDEFEGYGHPHGLRIAMIADAIGKQFNLAAHDRFFMQQAALVHDIGEVVMNRDYIKESRVLTPDEFLDVQRHPVIGEQETARGAACREAFSFSSDGIMNGGTAVDIRTCEGEQIPLAARILRVADSYAALTDNRPRRQAMVDDEAKRYMIEWTGLEFDPKVVKAFLAVDTEHYVTSAAPEATPERKFRFS